jgi:hypothetical protein
MEVEVAGALHFQRLFKQSSLIFLWSESLQNVIDLGGTVTEIHHFKNCDGFLFTHPVSNQQFFIGMKILFLSNVL